MKRLKSEKGNVKSAASRDVWMMVLLHGCVLRGDVHPSVERLHPCRSVSYSGNVVWTATVIGPDGFSAGIIRPAQSTFTSSTTFAYSFLTELYDAARCKASVTLFREVSDMERMRVFHRSDRSHLGDSRHVVPFRFCKASPDHVVTSHLPPATYWLACHTVGVHDHNIARPPSADPTPHSQRDICVVFSVSQYS
ncbi:hypothetical protein XU18_4795 [Perkinsela sp. CCAP 1560/4]|nr:hypothetical protein XU18_4795 [Perkinsela sp. CCAP 1560/4]|eukprot:KNH03906.1 hypothetical protein XU18_4795 [Perkinsela sp. CCAP 1560/4]